MADLEHYLQSGSLLACSTQTAQKNYTTVRKQIKLYNNPNPLEFNQGTPNAYQIIPFIFATTWLTVRHKPPSIWRETLSFEDRGSPGTVTQQFHTPAQSIVFRTTPPPGIYPGYSKCIPKKLAGSTGATDRPYGPACWPPRAHFLEFSLISVNSKKLFGAHDKELKVVRKGG